jgi:hypothetical protein
MLFMVTQTLNGGLLNELLALSEAPPDQILEFVRRWGPIDLINHVRRYRHLPSLGEARKFAESLLQCSIPGNLERDNETCAVYRAGSKHIQYTLDLAAEIYNTRDESRWLARFPYHCEDCTYGIWRARQTVEDTVRDFLDLGSVSFSLEWKEDQWQIEVRFLDTLGAIAVKLMLAVARADSLYMCYGCKKAYVRSAQVGSDGITHRRRPRADQRNYCLDCGRKSALLDAKRRNRKKHHDARRLYELDGKCIQEISTQLQTTEQRVQEWVDKGRWKRGKRGAH